MWLSWAGCCFIKHLYKKPQTKAGCSWQVFSFYSHYECFINKFLEERFSILCVLKPLLKTKIVLSRYWFWTYLYQELVLCKWVNLVKLAIKKCFHCSVFIFEKKKTNCLLHKYCKIKLFRGVSSHGVSSKPEAYLESTQMHILVHSPVHIPKVLGTAFL